MALAAMKPILIIVLLALVVGCNRAPVVAGSGGGAGSYANDDGRTCTAVVTHLDSQQNLLFLIAWDYDRGEATNTLSDRGLLEAVRRPQVHPSFDRRGVYALQADHTLKGIPLTPEQIELLFRDVQSNGFHPRTSELWQKEIVPRLQTVRNDHEGS